MTLRTVDQSRVPPSRVWHGTLAVLTVANLLLQVVLTAQLQSDTVGVRLVRLFSFFTVQSNVLVAVGSGTLALATDRDGRRWRVLRLTSLLAITVTFLVYLVVLRPIVHNQGWAAVTDTVFHFVVPIAAMLGWVLFGPRPRIDGRTVAWSLLFPMAWLVYTLLRGSLVHEWPYPFVDVDELGLGRVLVNAVGVAALFLGLAGAYAVADRRLRRAPRVGEVAVP